MPGNARRDEHAGQADQIPRRGMRRHTLAWLISLGLLSALIIPALVYARSVMVARVPGKLPATMRGLPADLFIQSVVTDDGSLAWHQLCRGLQAQLPQGELMQQAGVQRQAATQHGLKLAAEFIGEHPRPAGGELRVYIVTAHWLNGTSEQRTYSVLTQASGCVEDVKSQ
jgi:hypothetical protein